MVLKIEDRKLGVRQPLKLRYELLRKRPPEIRNTRRSLEKSQPLC
jgi:hypothetical protein